MDYILLPSSKEKPDYSFDPKVAETILRLALPQLEETLSEIDRQMKVRPETWKLEFII